MAEISHAQVRAATQASQLGQGIVTDAHKGPSAGLSYQAGNRSGNLFSYASQDIAPGKVASYSKLTGTSIYGANEGKETPSPVRPLGAAQ